MKKEMEMKETQVGPLCKDKSTQLLWGIKHDLELSNVTLFCLCVFGHTNQVKGVANKPLRVHNERLHLFIYIYYCIQCLFSDDSKWSFFIYIAPH